VLQDAHKGECVVACSQHCEERFLCAAWHDADVVPEEVDVLLVDDSSIAENERGMFALRMSREINLADHVHAKMSLVDELYSVRSLLRESPKFKGLSDEERRAANVDGKMRKRMGEEVSRFVLPHCQMSHVSRYVRANAMFEDSPKAYRKFLELFETHRETRKRWNVTCLSVNVLYVAEAELKVLIIEAIHMYLVGVKAALRAPADGIVATATATFYNEGVKVVASKWNIDAAIVLDQTFTRGSSMQETCARDQLRAMITKATLYDGSGTSKGRKQTPNHLRQSRQPHPVWCANAVSEFENSELRVASASDAVLPPAA